MYVWGPIILFVVTSATISAGRTNGHRSSSSSNSEEILMDTSSPPDAATVPLPEDDFSEDEHLRAWINSIPDEFISDGEEPIDIDITPPEAHHFQPRGPTIDSTNQADISSTSTTDDFIAGVDITQPDERADFFARVKAKLDIRDAVAHPRPPRVQRPATIDAGTQTYISLDPTLPQHLDRTTTAALHHQHGFEPGATGTFRDRNPLLHSRDVDTRKDVTYGPIATARWPPYMREINAETQTPFQWSHLVHPTRAEYLLGHVPRGHHRTTDGSTRIAVPPPAHAHIPSTADRHGIKGAAAPYASTLLVPAPRWPRGPPSATGRQGDGVGESSGEGNHFR